MIAGGLRAAGLTGRDLAAIGITNQRETTVVWDPTTGQPWHNAIVWQDTRTAAAVAALEPHRARLVERTGLPPSTYFSSTKLRWLLDHVDGLRDAAGHGRAIFGTIDTWVVWNLTGGVDGGLHVTDVTNASRTQLMNLRTLDWDDELLALFDIPRSMLPAHRAIIVRVGVRDDTRQWPRGRGGADRRMPRRPACRHGRPGLLRARRGEEHLWHRQLPAAQHGRTRRRRRTPGC